MAAEPTASVPLNGSYYGPPVPPYAPPPRRLSCCNSLGNLFCAMFKLVVFLIIVIGVSALIIWLIFRPNELKVHVEDSTLTQFNLSTGSNNNLIYNLTLNISVRNPNRKIGIYYDFVEALAIYDDTRFGFQQLPTFYQGHKNTTMLNPVFASQGFLFGGAPARYAAEKAEGFYNIEVKVHTSVRIKAGIIKTHHIKPKFDCKVRLPAPATGKSNLPAFQRTKCDVDY